MILLDTHVLLWMAKDDSRLPARVRGFILEARKKTGIAVATITLRELAWLAHHGRIQTAASPESFVRELVSHVTLQPITPEIAALSVNMPHDFPKDPADCLIAATAMAEGMKLVTADAHIRKAKVVETIW